MYKLILTILLGALVILPHTQKFSVFNGYKQAKRISVSATCYYPDPNQCWGDIYETASMARINPDNPIGHRWIAISRDLKEHLKFGDWVFVTGTGVYDGYWQVQDVMNKRFKLKIDFLVNHDSYLNHWKDVEIILSE